MIRYAVTELGFTFGDIVLYAWSIGESCKKSAQHTVVKTVVTMDTVSKRGKREKECS